MRSALSGNVGSGGVPGSHSSACASAGGFSVSNTFAGIAGATTVDGESTMKSV
jgi:hypothetical protein